MLHYKFHHELPLIIQTKLNTPRLKLTMASTISEAEWASLLSDVAVFDLLLDIHPPVPAPRNSPNERLNLLTFLYQSQITDAGFEQVYPPVLSRAAAYLLAHLPILSHFTDDHVDRFLFDFCKHYTLGLTSPYIEANLPFSKEAPVSHFAETWKLELGWGIFEAEGKVREPVFVLNDLEGLGRLFPVASGLVTGSAARDGEKWALGYGGLGKGRQGGKARL